MAHFFPGGIAVIYVAAALTPAGAEPVDFTRDVHPILAERCFACHGGDKRSGGLSLKDYREVMRGGRSGKVVTPGSGNDSLLIRRVLGEAGLVMPPAGARLSAEQIAKLRAWIDQGARERWNSAPARPNWVAKLALEKPQAGADSVDGILARYFEKLGKAQPRPAPDRVFARRAYLDAWGLPPSPEQWSEFAAASGPDKRARLVRVLLANRRNYAEHWITFWNDLLRNDEGVNYHGGRKSITGWLYRALEDNLPYNQFVAALLNPVAEGDPDGFLMGVNWRGDVSASQTPVMQAAQNSAQVFLGVNLKCNSCHDSFISRWKLKDAYGLASFFSDTRLELVRCDVRMGEYAEPKFLYPELGGAKASDTLWARQAIAARLFTAPANGRLARTIVNRVWQRLMGHGLVEPVDDMDAEPWNPELLDWLAWDFADHGYDLKHLIARIMTSSAYQMPATDPDHSENYVFRGPEFRRLTAEQFMDTLSAITGEWRVLTQPRERLAVYARDWRLASSPLTRALGRPIRDQVFTERSTDATTLQALETVNGETLTPLSGPRSEGNAGRVAGSSPKPVRQRSHDPGPRAGEHRYQRSERTAAHRAGRGFLFARACPAGLVGGPPHRAGGNREPGRSAGEGALGDCSPDRRQRVHAPRSHGRNRPAVPFFGHQPEHPLFHIQGEAGQGTAGAGRRRPAHATHHLEVHQRYSDYARLPPRAPARRHPR